MSDFKPIAVRADNAKEIALWCGGRVVEEHDALDHSSITEAVNVPTKNGVKRASFGDVVIEEFGTFSVMTRQEWLEHIDNLGANFPRKS